MIHISDRIGLRYVSRIAQPLKAKPKSGMYIQWSAVDGAVSTTSTSYVNDTYATLPYAVEHECYYLTIYNESNDPGDTQGTLGKRTAIKIDDVLQDRSLSNHSAGYTNNPLSTTSTLYGIEDEGNHFVQGVYSCTESGYTSSIRIRQVLHLGIPTTYKGKILGSYSSTVRLYNSVFYTDDPDTAFTFTTDEPMHLIAIYNVNTKKNNNSTYYGWKQIIVLDGVQDLKTLGATSSVGTGYPTRCRSLLYKYLSPGEHSIKGQIALNYAGTYVYVSDRQLIVLLLPLDFEVYASMSDTQVYTTSTDWTNDPYAYFSITTDYEPLFVAFYNTSNLRASQEYGVGKSIAIKQDGEYAVLTRNGSHPYLANHANNNFTIWHNWLGDSAGTHELRGVYKSHSSGQRVTIDCRQFIVVVMPEYLFPYPE